MDDPAHKPDLVIPSHGRGRLTPAWTSEQAAEAGRRGGEARKGAIWSWEREANRMLRKRDPVSGERKRSQVAQKLVEMALGGDAKSIELLARLSGWRPESKRTVEHGLAPDIQDRLRIVSAQSLPTEQANPLALRDKGDSGHVAAGQDGTSSVVESPSSSVTERPPATDSSASSGTTTPPSPGIPL